MSSTPADHKPSPWIAARIAGLVWRITPDCREVTRLSSEAREHSLPFTTRTRVGLHRLFCRYCARYAAQLDILRDAARELPEHSSIPGLRADAKARLRQALQKGAVE